MKATGVPMQETREIRQIWPLFGGYSLGLRKALRTSRKVGSGLAQGLRTWVLRTQVLHTRALHTTGWCGNFLPNRLASGFGSMILAVSIGFGAMVGVRCAEAAHSSLYQFAFTGDRAVVMREDAEVWQYFAAATDTPVFKRIPPAPGMFRPLRLVAGFAGHVYVQDAAQTRLCLYDTAGQWLSCRAFPEPLQNRRPDRVLVIARRDGRFVFIDQDRAMATLWREARQGDGQGAWQLLASVSVPTGLDACLERPWFENLCCLKVGKPQAEVKSESQSRVEPVCFDAFLNTLPTPSRAPDSALLATPRSGAWHFRIGPPYLRLDAASQRAGFCFDPTEGFRPCPAPGLSP